MKEIRILGLSKLGYGFPMDSLERGMKENPHVLAVDGGSTDLGPFPLAGRLPLPLIEKTILRDFKIELRAARERRIPYIVGSVGIAGNNEQLEYFARRFKEVAKEAGYHFRMAIISSEIDREYLKHRLRTAPEGIEDLTHQGNLTVEHVERSSKVVAQMGHQPIVQALREGAEMVVCGRACDNALFAALPILQGFDPGLSLHAGKILECGAIAADPGSSSDIMIGTIREDHFLIAPTNPNRRATVRSIAEHSLYEQRDPYTIQQPGGYVDTREARYEPVDQRTVKVFGSRWVPVSCKVKLEGAGFVGYRSFIIGSVRDEAVIQNLDYLLEIAQARTRDNFPDIPKEAYHLIFHVYGRDGTLGALEPLKSKGDPHEVGLLIEAVGKTQEIATTVCAFAKSIILHAGFEGRKSTAGNLAVPFSPDLINAGEVAEFTIYHLLPVKDPGELFPIRFEEV